MIVSWLRIQRARHYISPIQLRCLNSAANDGIYLVLVIKDEADRLPFFLEYYRSIGVSHFFILDNESSDDLHDIVRGSLDVSLFSVSQRYSEANFGVDWINFIARKYCVGSWVLSVDSDEILDFPHSESRNLGDLCDHLDDCGQRKFYAPMLDMYGSLPVMGCDYQRGQNPLDKCQYFDARGYFTVLGSMGEPWLRGGVRMRVFNPENPLSSPALNKYPLLKWTRSTFYVKGAHTVLSFISRQEKPSNLPTGVLLHFKFFSDLYKKACYAVEHGNHYQGSKEYKNYLQEITRLEKSLKYEGSQKYLGPNTLLSIGLMQIGNWH